MAVNSELRRGAEKGGRARAFLSGIAPTIRTHPATHRSSVAELQSMIPPSSPFLLVNGLSYDTREFNLYDFVDVLRREVGGGGGGGRKNRDACGCRFVYTVRVWTMGLSWPESQREL